MKQRRLKKWKCMFVVILAVSIFLQQDVFAAESIIVENILQEQHIYRLGATKNVKKIRALKAYNSFLKKQISSFEVIDFDYETRNKEKESTVAEFLLVDLDKNGIPELVTIHNEAFKWNKVKVYTYKKGKVVTVRKSKIDLNTQAIGNAMVYKCQNGHLHIDISYGIYGFTDITYKVKNNVLKKYLVKTRSGEEGEVIYQKSGKRVSENVYYKLNKKCSKNYYSIKNNAKNRKKYLK